MKIGAQQFIQRFSDKNFRNYTGSLMAFYEMYFDEALKNYTDKICEKQREGCVYAISNMGIHNFHIVEESILNVPMPEPINLKILWKQEN